MRTAIVIIALACSPVCAHAAEDRYGPPPAPRLLAAASVAGQTQVAQPPTPTPYTGRMLGWTGKTAPRAVEPQAAPVPPSVAPPAPVAVRPLAPQQAPQPRAAALPQTIYDRPAPAPQAVTQPAPQYTPPAPQPPQAAARPSVPFQPQVTPQRAPTLPPVPAAQRVANTGDSVRSYSVAREFDGQPNVSALPPPVSYWATRQQAQPISAQPAYTGGDAMKNGEIEVTGGVGEDPEAAPRPVRKRETKS